MPEDWKAKLATAVRVGRGLKSQNELASQSGVCNRTISLLEGQHIQNPRFNTIVRLAIAIESDPREWLSWIGIGCDQRKIDVLRKAIEPFQADEITKVKEQFTAYVNEAISSLELRLSTKLRNEIREYLDSRMDQLARRLSNIEELPAKKSRS